MWKNTFIIILIAALVYVMISHYIKWAEYDSLMTPLKTFEDAIDRDAHETSSIMQESPRFHAAQKYMSGLSRHYQKVSKAAQRVSFRAIDCQLKILSIIYSLEVMENHVERYHTNDDTHRVKIDLDDIKKAINDSHECLGSIGPAMRDFIKSASDFLEAIKSHSSDAHNDETSARYWAGIWGKIGYIGPVAGAAAYAFGTLTPFTAIPLALVSMFGGQYKTSENEATVRGILEAQRILEEGEYTVSWYISTMQNHEGTVNAMLEKFAVMRKEFSDIMDRYLPHDNLTDDQRMALLSKIRSIIKKLHNFNLELKKIESTFTGDIRRRLN